MTLADPFDLERFVTAQAAVFPAVLAELKAGRKRTHWMWFVFPQLRGLGHSSMATFYGIASLHEARAYLGHPLLEPRLDLCTRIVLELEAGSLHEIRWRGRLTRRSAGSTVGCRSWWKRGGVRR